MAKTAISIKVTKRLGAALQVNDARSESELTEASSTCQSTLDYRPLFRPKKEEKKETFM